MTQDEIRAALPSCARAACEQKRAGVSTFCCVSCEKNEPGHCRDCGKFPQYCCLEAAMHGGFSHRADCMVKNKRLKKKKKSKMATLIAKRKKRKGKAVAVAAEVAEVPGPAGDEVEVGVVEVKAKAAKAKVKEGSEAKAKAKAAKAQPAAAKAKPKVKAKLLKQPKRMAKAADQGSQGAGFYVNRAGDDILISNKALMSTAGNTMSPPVVGSSTLR